MSESLEPTPADPPASPPLSLLRRLFRPVDIGFLLMIALAWIGAVYTTFNVESSRWYWQWLIPIFGLICIITQWYHVESTLKTRTIMVARQLLHWGVVLLMTFLVFMASGQNAYIDTLDDRQASFVLMYTLTLSTFLAGIYFDWRLCVVAVFLIISAIVNVLLSNTAPLLVWMGGMVIAAYLLGDWWYNRWLAQRAQSRLNHPLE